MTRPTPSVSEKTPPEDAGCARRVRGPPRLPEAEPRFRLHRLQANQPDAPRAGAHAGTGDSRFAAYLDFLQVDAEEFTRLFNTILINVTSFFRDPANWEYLRDEILPGLIGAPDAAARSASGARAVPRARRPIRSPFSSRRRWAPTHSASG